MSSKPRKTSRLSRSRRVLPPHRSRGTIASDLKKLNQASAGLVEFAKAALRESQRRLDEITASSRDAIMLFEPGGKIIQVTATIGTLFGYSPNELVGQRITSLFPEGLPASEALHRKRLSSSLSPKHWHLCRDVLARQKNGMTIRIDVRLTTIRTQHNQAVLASISDLTQRRLKVEAALHESEERLRLALFSANIAIWEWDVATNHLSWSPTAEDIFGIEPASVRRYESFTQRIHPDDLAGFEAAREKAVCNHQAFVFEFRILRVSGEIRWVSANGRAYYGPTGQPIRVLGTIRDITDRYRADAAVLESEARFRNVFEHAATGIAITTLEGRFRRCNPAYCKLIGYSISSDPDGAQGASLHHAGDDERCPAVRI